MTNDFPTAEDIQVRSQDGFVGLWIDVKPLQKVNTKDNTIFANELKQQIIADNEIVERLKKNLEIKKFWQSQGKTEYDKEINFVESILKENKS